MGRRNPVTAAYRHFACLLPAHQKAAVEMLARVDRVVLTADQTERAAPTFEAAADLAAVMG